MHVTPKTITPNIKKLCEYIQVESIQYVEVQPEEDSILYDCHNNCDYSEFHRVTGYYIAADIAKGCYSLVKHSVVRKYDKLVDITPSKFDSILFIQTNNLYHKYYTYLGDYLYMNYTDLKNQPETINNYYIYALVNPIDNTYFYVGKGKKNRWIHHMSEKSLQDNTHKSNKIKNIHSSGFRVGIKFLEYNIVDEEEAYNKEKEYIIKYGRVVDGGILTNVCIDANPPNHKGKTYNDIYGENAEIQRSRRHNMQIQAGGWFSGQKHTLESKQKISKKASNMNNGNCSGLTEDDYIIHGLKFCNDFDFIISRSKWKYYCKKTGIPTAFNTFRFNNTDILKVFCEKFNAEIKWEQQPWYNNGVTQIRLSDWLVLREGIPENFTPGRLQIIK